MCSNWHTRKSETTNVLTDVYDGRVWQQFEVVDGKPFLNAPNSFALQLNIDWFQPFNNLHCSLGVMLLSIMNLPREERYKQENMIICGLIPGPKSQGI